MQQPNIGCMLFYRSFPRFFHRLEAPTISKPDPCLHCREA